MAMQMETINILTEVEPWPTRKLPQQQFDVSVKTCMDQTAAMTGELNEDFIPKVNALGKCAQDNAASAILCASNAKTSETNAKKSEINAKSSESACKASESRVTAAADVAFDSASSASLDAVAARRASEQAEAVSGIHIATKDRLGIVRPDNKTLEIDVDGVLKVLRGAGGGGLVSLPEIDLAPSTDLRGPLSFASQASSNLIVPRAITEFLYSIPELGILEKGIAAVNDSAQITAQIPSSMTVGSTVTVKIQAFDSEGAGSEILTQQTVLRAEMLVTPPMILPQANATIAKSELTLATNSFRVQSYQAGVAAQSDAHIATQWRIRRASGEREVVFDSGESASLTRLVISSPPTALKSGEAYLFEARHKGQRLGFSQWSAPVTANLIDAPLFSRKQAFMSAGDYVFTVPLGVSRLKILCVGAGGAGEMPNNADAPARGGKGGGIISAIVNVTPGESVPLTVARVGNPGEETRFGNIIKATSGTYEKRGEGSVHSGRLNQLLLNLADIPEGKFCRSVEDLRDNKWTQSARSITRDILFSQDGAAGGAASNGNAGLAGSQRSTTAGGKGGKGGDGWTGSVYDGSTAGKGGNGGEGVESGGGGGNGGDYYNGGAGGNGGDGLKTGGTGGNGGAGGFGYTSANSACNGGYGGDGGNGGSGNERDGNGGRGGNGGDAPWTGGKGGSGGNGGSGLVGGKGGNAGNTAQAGYSGRNGGAGGQGSARGGDGGIGGAGGTSNAESYFGLKNPSSIGGAGGRGGNAGYLGMIGGRGGNGGDGGKGGKGYPGYSAVYFDGGKGGDGDTGGIGGDGGDGGMAGLNGKGASSSHTLNGKGGNGGAGCIVIWY